jgi:glycosyltransferase involved in cell wall biosynthesis
LHSLGNRFIGEQMLREGAAGRRNVAVIFFEDAYLPGAAAVCARYDHVITGSRWAESVLRAQGVRHVTTVFQGIDHSVFFPGPKMMSLPGRFAIFSGGKIESRKGQDLVVQAFRAFATRHPEAILVTAWNSPWPSASLTLNSLSTLRPLTLTADGDLNVPQWLVDNGLRPDQFIDLGRIANAHMGAVLRQMDCALFPNRCEGGTNLVAMEAMACGVPTIVSANSGHLDLIATGGAFPLRRQGLCRHGDWDTQGWGESDIDEMVENLEQIWRHRADAAVRAHVGSEALQQWSWQRQLGQLHHHLLPLYG